MSCGIYKIVNDVDGKMYIGSSITLGKRLKHHESGLLSDAHHNNYLQNSVNKYGIDKFRFEIIEECHEDDLVDRENHHIKINKANDSTLGFNSATVNEFRRNCYNNEVKIKNSRLGLKMNGNFTKFKAINIETKNEMVFDNLVDAATYLIREGFTTAKKAALRQRISECLRGSKINTGSNWAIRKWLRTISG